MRVRLPSRRVFPHAVSYKECVGMDVWKELKYSDPIEIPFVRVDEGYEFNRSGNNASDEMPNALIVLFKAYNSNLPRFKNESIILFKGMEFTIVKVIPLYLMSDEVIGYELEVK